MKPSLLLFALIATLGLAACDPEGGRYPFGGQECGPADPVRDVSARDCVSPTGTGV